MTVQLEDAAFPTPDTTMIRKPALLLLVVATGCTAVGGDASSRWAGTVDTLASGQIVVHNSATPIWAPGQEWQVTEDLRIGSVDGDGPDVLGNVTSFEIDRAGRIRILEGQTQQLRVFAADGSFVRTLGRSGGGPGEFARAMRVELGPDGNLWVMDPSNNRLSVFDTAGTYLEGKRALGGFIMIPWPGRFDSRGRYYAPVPRTGAEFRIGLLRYDTAFTPADTLDVPIDPVERESFRLSSPDGHSMMVAGVPFQGGFRWKVAPNGGIWAFVTDQYRLFELDNAGDTIRTITRDYDPLPVTDEDREQAKEDMKWFLDQGGRADWSKLPDVKPAATSFFLDDEGDIWVERVTEPGSDGSSFDVFDPRGRFLGNVRTPFALSGPEPIIRDGTLWGVTRDALEVPYIVRARIEKPQR